MLLTLSHESYQLEIVDKHVSVLDLLERFPNIPISIEEYLGMMPVMRPRVYSIVSHPGWVLGQCSLVAAVINEPHWSGRGQFLAVALRYIQAVGLLLRDKLVSRIAYYYYRSRNMDVLTSSPAGCYISY
jgi:sulfite reductase alpha subunit-like flavoprotein